LFIKLYLYSYLYEVRNTLRPPTRNIFLGSNNTRPPKEILYYWFEYLSITNRRYNYIKVISSNDTSTTYNDNYLVQDTPRQPNQTGSKKKYSSLSSLAQFHLTTE